ncbi:transcription elongation factor 1 homolog [Brachypodium distachyon]|uniref:Transcription elongation factor 1 homolog n=1 Tax=Brachypodium distachyon TaxID=15368 RepID=I1H0W6_BRADI|nr:transcription elongation factor 1 homolog [Brachypodium distachyon]KQK19538.1 hypothetical protein BRADI_1g48890v3 [Brachypodium distachyon]|eukprot:XP_003561077.1 transcription elongation factor 1 homolog [Brachypodium distachyon]
MGKRGSQKPAPKKKPQKLETTFTCPFCQRADGVECSIDLKLRIAVATCWACEETYATKAHSLTEPLDVYSEWIDECEKANQEDHMEID